MIIFQFTYSKYISLYKLYKYEYLSYGMHIETTSSCNFLDQAIKTKTNRAKRKEILWRAARKLVAGNIPTNLSCRCWTQKGSCIICEVEFTWIYTRLGYRFVFQWPVSADLFHDMAVLEVTSRRWFDAWFNVVIATRYGFRMAWIWKSICLAMFSSFRPQQISTCWCASLSHA